YPFINKRMRRVIMASLAEIEKGKLLKTLKAGVASASSNLSALLGKSVVFAPESVQDVPWDELGKDSQAYVCVRVQLEGDLDGFQFMLFKIKDAAVMADLIIGGGGANPPEELNDLYLSAVTEALGQLMDAM